MLSVAIFLGTWAVCVFIVLCCLTFLYKTGVSEPFYIFSLDRYVTSEGIVKQIQCGYEPKELCQIFTLLMQGKYSRWDSDRNGKREEKREEIKGKELEGHEVEESEGGREGGNGRRMDNGMGEDGWGEEIQVTEKYGY